MNIKDQQAKNVLFWDKHGIKSLFEKNIPEVVRWAKMSPDEAGFVGLLREKICECFPDGRNTGLLLRMTGQEGQRVHEISRDEDIGLDTFSMLWRVLSQEDGTEDVSEDFLLDLYFLFLGCKSSMPVDRPERSSVVKWMRRWPDGMNERVLSVREENKRRIINVLIQKVALRKSSSGRYVFPDGSTETEKRLLVENWWNDYHFHLAMAAKTPQELNRMLGNKLPQFGIRNSS